MLHFKSKSFEIRKIISSKFQTQTYQLWEPEDLNKKTIAHQTVGMHSTLLPPKAARIWALLSVRKKKNPFSPMQTLLRTYYALFSGRCWLVMATLQAKIANANWLQIRSHEIRGDQGCQQSEAHQVSASLKPWGRTEVVKGGKTGKQGRKGRKGET